MATPADRIIDKFGGLTALARALGHKHPSTVQGWRERGYIPTKRQSEVVMAARKAGVAISFEDFFDCEPENGASAGTERAA